MLHGNFDMSLNTVNDDMSNWLYDPDMRAQAITQPQPPEGTLHFWPCCLKPMMRIEALLDRELHEPESLLYVMFDMGSPQQTQNSDIKKLKKFKKPQ